MSKNPLGLPFGIDFALTVVNGVVDFSPTMQTTTGRALLVQNLISRQTTPTGSVIDCPNDCFDVRDWISEGMTLQQLSQLGTTVSNELMKDQRLKSANVTAAFSLSTSQMILTEKFESLYGPFSFVLGISGVTIQLLDQNLSSPIPTLQGSTGAGSLA